uniref:Uncharacterized protein n=1 Tax=Romanomermis culicivorax TaxID=13658 RepID=A0A915L8B7_ROMCU
MAKSLMMTQTSIPLLSIIINNYKDNRMRSLTLKFEQELTFNIAQLDENRMLPYFKFTKRLHLMVNSMKEEEFTLEHDTGISSGGKSVHLLDVEKSEKATTNSMLKTKQGATICCKIMCKSGSCHILRLFLV